MIRLVDRQTDGGRAIRAEKDRERGKHRKCGDGERDGGGRAAPLFGSVGHTC